MKPLESFDAAAGEYVLRWSSYYRIDGAGQQGWTQRQSRATRYASRHLAEIAAAEIERSELRFYSPRVVRLRRKS